MLAWRCSRWGGTAIGSLLDPPGGCYRTDFDVPFWVEVDRPATLDATLVPTKFSPFLAVHRGCSGANVACGSTALQGLALTPGGYLVVVSSHALGSGPDVGRFALSLTFTSDGG